MGIMMVPLPVVRAVSLCLFHVPDLVRYGSKPSRDSKADPGLLAELAAHRRTYSEAVAYAPNQVFIGNVNPVQLWDYPEPWFDNLLPDADRIGRDGEIMAEEEFYCLMKACDDFDLFWLEGGFVAETKPLVAQHSMMRTEDLTALANVRSVEEIHQKVDECAAIPISVGDRVVGCLLHGHPEDSNLDANVLLENLAAKASAVLALRHALHRAEGLASTSVEYVIGCGEEAVGDRYQRGGGNLAKAVGEKSGCFDATGSDLKAFCCAPNHAIVSAAAFVRSGLYRTVAVVGGGSLAKLGMKYSGHLKHNMPVLEDMLGAVAVILSDDDERSPVVDLECVGRQTIGAGSSQQAIAEAIVLNPLAKVGLRLIDVDRFATELQNPEITVPQGSGNVPKTNYRIIAGMALRKGEINKEEVDAFVRERGMPGFSPTQGHIASAIPFLGHARHDLVAGDMDRAFFYAKGSLFLGRMTQLADGLSFLLRANPKRNPK